MKYIERPVKDYPNKPIFKYLIPYHETIDAVYDAVSPWYYVYSSYNYEFVKDVLTRYITIVNDNILIVKTHKVKDNKPIYWEDKTRYYDPARNSDRYFSNIIVNDTGYDIDEVEAILYNAYKLDKTGEIDLYPIWFEDSGKVYEAPANIVRNNDDGGGISGITLGIIAGIIGLITFIMVDK